MKLKKIKGVDFDPICHKYYCEGKELIGVTSLMAKHNLSPDYSDIPQAVLEKAADKGTAIHRLLEDYDNGKVVAKTDAEKRTIKDYKALGLTHLASEYLVSDRECVASFIDKVYEVGENEVELCDVKTTSKLHERALSWQLSIYKHLFLLLNPKIKIRGLSVLQFDKNTGELKAYKPVREIPEGKVKELLECEKMELPFEDTEEDAPTADLALNEVELTAYLSISERLIALKNTMDVLTEKKKEYDAKVLAYMEKEGLTTLAAETGEFRYRKGSIRTTIDSKALKATYPDIAERFSKQSETSPSLTFVPYA